MANMGIAVGDYDGDGLTDVFITHLGNETHTLWRQGPVGFFRDQHAGLPGGPDEVAGDRVRGGGGRLRPGRVARHRVRERQGVPRPGASRGRSPARVLAGVRRAEPAAPERRRREVRRHLRGQPGVLRHDRTSPAGWRSATSTTTAGRTCWSCRSATAPGCTGTSRPAGTGSGCARSTRDTADGTPTGRRCA